MLSVTAVVGVGLVPLQRFVCSGHFCMPRPTLCYFGFMLGKGIACDVMAAKNNIINVVMKKKRGTVSNINSGHKCTYVYI